MSISIVDDPLNRVSVYVSNLEGAYYSQTPHMSGFNELADLARRALKAEKGVDTGAKGPTSTYPVYIETPDKEVEGRIRYGAISPDNPYYGPMQARVGILVKFPGEIVPPPPHILPDDIFPENLRSHRFFEEARTSLEMEIRLEEEHPGASAKGAALRADAITLVRMHIRELERDSQAQGPCR